MNCEYRTYLLLEAHVEYAVRFIEDQQHQLGCIEADGLLEMLEQSTRRCH